MFLLLKVCDFVRHEIRTNPDLEAICSHLVDVCLFKGSRDNMSVVLIVFPGAPSIDEKLVQASTAHPEAIQTNYLRNNSYDLLC